MRKMKFYNYAIYLCILSVLLNSCSDDEVFTSDYCKTEYTYYEGIDLFCEDERNTILTEVKNEMEIEFSAGPEVTFCWITSQQLVDENCFPEKEGGGFMVITKGDCYYPTPYKDGYAEGEIISKILAYPLAPKERYLLPVLSGVDWSDTGVEIIDTHENKEIPYDNCEFVYRGWLQVTLGGEDEEHRFIRLKSIAEAPEGFEVALLYFNPAYDFVNNLITVTQRGYAPSE